MADISVSDAGNSFTTINVPSGTDPQASSLDTLNLTSSGGTVTITGDASTDTINLEVAAPAGTAFGTVVGTGGTNPVADSASDTLTFTSADASLVINGTAGTDTLDFSVTPNFVDSQFRIRDNADVSKNLALEVSSISTSTTRVWTVPDADLNFTANSAVAGSFANRTLSNLGTTAINADLIPGSNDTLIVGNTTSRFSAIVSSRFISKGSSGDVIRSLDNSDVVEWEWHNNLSSPSGTANLKGLRYITSGGIIQSENNATANATATKSLYLETGNKTAGTGDSGSITIKTGTSTGGAVGDINLAARQLNIKNNATLQGVITTTDYTTPVGNTAQYSVLGQLIDTTKVMTVGTINNATTDDGTMSLEISTGNCLGNSVDGTTGGVEIRSGKSESNNAVTFTGLAVLASGSHTGAGNTGEVDLVSGNVQTGTSGNVFINSGNALGTDGNTGTVDILTGTCVDGLGASGNLAVGSGDTDEGDTGAVTIRTGTPSGGNAATGDIQIVPGAPTGSGNQGIIILSGDTTVSNSFAVSLGSSVNITADNQVVTVDRQSYISLSSDNAVAASRTFLLTAGLRTGQRLLLEWTGTNAGELSASISGGGSVRMVAGTWVPTQYDTIEFVFNDAGDWIEICRSVNA